MARDQHTALLFPGQGSQTDDMREEVERHRPDLLGLALSEVGPDLFERATEGTRRLSRRSSALRSPAGRSCARATPP